MTVQELFKAAQELNLAEQFQLANQLMQSVIQKMQLTVGNEQLPDTTDDPLIGMYSGSSDLSTRAKTILNDEINPSSGFSWKA